MARVRRTDVVVRVQQRRVEREALRCMQDVEQEGKKQSHVVRRYTVEGNA
jgi:hypothetical protein